MSVAAQRSRRWQVVAMVLVVLTALAVADRGTRRPVRAARSSSLTSASPTASPAGAISSSWFCAGGTARAGSAADARVVVANPGAAPLSARVTVVPDKGEPKTVPLAVPARSRVELLYRDVVAADYAAALVDIDGGGAIVEHQADGPLGRSSSPCASSASRSWYFAEGATAKDASLVLFLFNPFPEDAIADISFSTDQGRAVPSDFQGLVVEGGHVGVVDVGTHVRRREAVSTTVSARSGRLVVDKLQTRTAPGSAGMSLSLGSPSLGDVFYFPEGYVSPGLTERFHVYNPNDRESAVDLELALEQGAAEPFELTVPPRGRVVVETSKESRVPPGVAHAATIRVGNGVPVVAERTIEATAPSARTGRSVLLGAREAAEAWAFAAGGVTEDSDEWLVVDNPGRRRASVSVTVLADGQPLPVEGLQSVAVPAGRRVSLRLGDHLRRQDAALVVRSTQPVVVERDIYRVGATGLSASTGVILP